MQAAGRTEITKCDHTGLFQSQLVVPHLLFSVAEWRVWCQVRQLKGRQVSERVERCGGAHTARQEQLLHLFAARGTRARSRRVGLENSVTGTLSGCATGVGPGACSRSSN